MPKSDKYFTKKKKRERKQQVSKTDEHRRKNPQQNSCKQKPTTHKNHWVGFIPGMQRFVTYANQLMWYIILTN